MSIASQGRCVIVNADDFGFSLKISEGILRAHREGIVTSTTLVANMPASEQAAAMLRDARDLGVGVHLNLSQGPPLSQEGLALAGEGGWMDRTAGGFLLACCVRPALLQAAQAECEAQIRWVLDHGIMPTHLDSHRHAHAFPPLFRRVAELARRYHVRFVRWHGEHLTGGGWPKAPLGQRATSFLLNRFAAVNAAHGADLRATTGTLGVAHTGRIDRAWLLRAAEDIGPGATEIMTHPGLVGQDLIYRTYRTRLVKSREVELAALCDPAVREAFSHNKGITRVHYGQL
jgi:predicted glycoside hydrolase/deacetylase ChbG (UPF0249 family)